MKTNAKTNKTDPALHKDLSHNDKETLCNEIIKLNAQVKFLEERIFYLTHKYFSLFC